MIIEVTMPNLGYDMQEGKLQSWLTAVGERVERGDAIAEIETDKATIEMEALASGTLVEILCPAGSQSTVGSVIAVIESED